MNDTELAFRCVELAVKNGAKDPAVLAKTYFDAAQNLLKADKSQGPATAGKTARPRKTQNS